MRSNENMEISPSRQGSLPGCTCKFTQKSNLWLLNTPLKPLFPGHVSCCRLMIQKVDTKGLTAAGGRAASCTCDPININLVRVSLFYCQTEFNFDSQACQLGQCVHSHACFGHRMKMEKSNDQPWNHIVESPLVQQQREQCRMPTRHSWGNPTKLNQLWIVWKNEWNFNSGLVWPGRLGGDENEAYGEEGKRLPSHMRLESR